MTALAWWTVLTLVAFAAGCAVKAYRYARMPLHVRWELYPVPHEKGRAEYGGSYFEDPEWWSKRREHDELAGLRFIASEVLTLSMVRERNPGLWRGSLLFHYGLYLLFALGACVVLQGVAAAAGLVGAGTGGVARMIVGGLGLAAGTTGAVLLLARRLGDPALRNASTPADFLHLGWLLVVFAASWGSWLFVDSDYRAAVQFVSGVAQGQVAASPSVWFTAQLILLGSFLAYLPSSHMTHFFAKFFTWHTVRWDDRPAIDDAARMKTVQALLARPVHWSAPHIGADGKRTWAEIATRVGGKS